MSSTLGAMIGSSVSMRDRIKIAVVLVLVIALGLASRKFPGLFPEVLGKYPGDALWSVAVYLAWAFAIPGATRIVLFVLAVCTSFLVEFSQLYHAPWIDSIRSSSIGHLFLGSTYNSIDLIAYTVGAMTVLIADFIGSKYSVFRVHSA